MSASSRRRRAFDIWPGFVDALTSLIMVMIFVLLLFAIGQFVLSDTLSGKNRALEYARSPQGKALIAGVGVLVTILVIRRLRRR